MEKDRTISLQAAIDAIKNADVCVAWNGCTDCEDIADIAVRATKRSVVDSVEALPSAQPEKVNEQIKWERDIAVQQLQALGYGLGEKIRTDSDTISRQTAIDDIETVDPSMILDVEWVKNWVKALPSVQPEEVIPHRNYKYLSDYWCACGWHLGKKGDVKYCADCGRKVNWDE